MMSSTRKGMFLFLFFKVVPNLNLFDPESHWMLQAKLLIFGLDNKHNPMG